MNYDLETMIEEKLNKNGKEFETDTTFADIYNINLGEQSPLTAKNGNTIENELMTSQTKNERQTMESKAILFSEQEKVFRERTGKDFSTLYTKYYPKLVYFTSKITNDQQRAEDISTDSFMAAFEKIEKYEKEKSQFSTWLFTIAKNLALQDLKVEKKTMSLDVEFDEEGTTMKDFIQEEESDNHFHEIQVKKAEIMKKHIAMLKSPYRDVIEMRELKKMSYKDISDKLNLNLSTVKSQIRNGRAILVRETKKEFDAIDEMLM
jgi:RNA polymerase sigma-70 factor (ECF subfamily)